MFKTTRMAMTPKIFSYFNPQKLTNGRGFAHF